MSEEPNLVKFNIDDTLYETAIPRKMQNRKQWEPIDLKVIKTNIPGNVRQIFVSEKQAVKPGDNLLILEAMKMKNLIKSPISGVVKKIYVKTNQQVPRGFVLIEIE